jgi:hypothetical protein
MEDAIFGGVTHNCSAAGSSSPLPVQPPFSTTPTPRAAPPATDAASAVVSRLDLALRS